MSFQLDADRDIAMRLVAHDKGLDTPIDDLVTADELVTVGMLRSGALQASFANVPVTNSEVGQGIPRYGGFRRQERPATQE